MEQSERSWQSHQGLLNEFGGSYASMAMDIRSAQQQLDLLRAQRGEPIVLLGPEMDATVIDWEKKGKDSVDYSRALQPLVDYEFQHK
ncbi:hypothetical protein HN747_00955 [archaeon]|jgi:hypothetical protein|nr:hypothetical protein [archaeon]